MGEFLAFLIPITLFLVVGGVLLLRPVTTRLGDLLEAIALEKKRDLDGPDTGRLQETIAALEQRIALLEERQNFTESLLTSGNHRAPAVIAGNANPRTRDLVP
jgi:hypothetical protein